MSTKSVSIRIEEEMLKKIGHIADFEGRSINSHILVLVREDIRKFENMYGEIYEAIEPALNVKPSGKK